MADEVVAVKDVVILDPPAGIAEAVAALDGAPLTDDIKEVGEAPPDPVEKAETPPEPKVEPPKEETETPISTAFLALQRKEKKLQDERKELQKLKAEIEATKTGAKTSQDIQARLRADLAGVLKEAGINPVNAAEILYASELGDKASPQLIAKVEANRVEREIYDLRQKVASFEEQQRQTAQLQAVREYKAQLAGSLAAVPDNLKYVKVLAAQDRTQVAEAMYELADQLASANPEGGIPNATELMGLLNQSLEERLKPFQSVFGSSLNQPATQQTSAKTAPRTLTNATHSGTTAPKGKPKTREEIEAEVIEALQKGELEL
jgi:hypothetical protein